MTYFNPFLRLFRGLNRAGSHTVPVFAAFAVLPLTFAPSGQVGNGVHGGAVDPDFEVQVGPCARAGAADSPDHLSPRDVFAGADGHRALVAVEGGDPAAV